MATHVTWASIHLLHNVVTTLAHLSTVCNTPSPTVTYRGKVKLHGTNCGVQVTPDGVFAQSRTGMLSLPSGDLKGFAAWVKVREALFAMIPSGVTLFGEWCGPGVERGMAVSRLPEKLFAVFGLQYGYGDDARIECDPEVIRGVLPDVPGLYVLPWEGAPITLDFRDKDALASAVEDLNTWLTQVEAEDPWVKRTFDVSGVGEGLVFYPVGESATAAPSDLATLMFKAKGEKHRTVGAKVAVQVDASVAASVDDFATLVVTEARLQQGMSQVCPEGHHLRHTGAFLAWVGADVVKECTDELTASNLTWAQVSKAVQTRAREWFLKQS